MGLGKTFVGSEKLKQLGADMNLLICQKSKIKDWKEHFLKFYPDYAVVVLTKQKPPTTGKVIIIVNYDLAWRRDVLNQLTDYTLMLDESSLIKNTTSNRTKFILKLKPKNVVLLSGTPVGGKYEELYSQLKLMGWDITKKLFYQQYIITQNREVGGFIIPQVVGYKNIDRLKAKLRDNGAVFMKTEEVFELPEAMHIPLPVQSTKEYAKFKKNRVIEIEPGVEIVGDTSLTKMLGERQLASFYNANKLQELTAILESTENRVVIFYNFQEECNKILKLCSKLNKPVSIVNGKEHTLDNYNNENNSVTLVQYQAGAMGINLQKSNVLVYYSLPLASELFEQSKKRIHRIGQTKTCFYYYLITKGSIEEKILEVLKQRKNFTDVLFEEL